MAERTSAATCIFVEAWIVGGHIVVRICRRAVLTTRDVAAEFSLHRRGGSAQQRNENNRRPQEGGHYPQTTGPRHMCKATSVAEARKTGVLLSHRVFRTSWADADDSQPQAVAPPNPAACARLPDAQGSALTAARIDGIFLIS